MNQQLNQQSMTASSISYRTYAYSGLANYISTTTPKQDLTIDTIKNARVIVPPDYISENHLLR